MTKLIRIVLGLGLIAGLFVMMDIEPQIQRDIDEAYCSCVRDGLWPEYKTEVICD